MIIISLLLIFVIGYLVVTSLHPSAGVGERLSLSLPLGLGLTTLIIWAMLVFHLPLSPTSLIVAQMFLAASLLYPAYQTKTMSLPLSRPAFPKANAGLILILLLVGAGLVFNVFFPIIVSDGIGYKIHGIIAVDRNNLMAFGDVLRIGDQNRTLGFQLISGFSYLFDFNYPKLVQSVFYASMLGFFYVSIRKFMDSGPARGMTLLLATAPMVWWHSFLYLNNLSAGFYFFCGTLYWFLSIHHKQPRYLLISSLFFMLASWIRYELILFFGISLAFTFFLSLKNREAKPFFSLLIFPFLFSGLWAAYSLIYFPEMKRSTHYLYIFLFFFVSGLAMGLIHALKIRFRLVVGAIITIIVITAILVISNEVFQVNAALLQRVILAKLINNVMVQSVWGLGILLALLIPIYYGTLQPSKKHLLFNLIFLFLGFTLFFSFFAMAHPMLDEPVIERIKFFFEFPGRIAVRTSSREFFILFPSLLFLLGISIPSQNASSGIARFFNKAISKHPLFNVLNILILGNFLVIAVLFLSPRVSFLKSHFGESFQEIQVTAGSRDNRNIYWQTYTIAHAISRLTPEDSTIIFPYPYGALKFEKKPYDSLGIFSAHDVLYPRTIYWEGMKQKFPKPLGNSKVYQVTYEGWLGNKCKTHPEGKPLGYRNWYLCPAQNDGNRKG